MNIFGEFQNATVNILRQSEESQVDLTNNPGLDFLELNGANVSDEGETQKRQQGIGGKW